MKFTKEQKMTEVKKDINIGGGFFSTLFFIFLILKLTKVINWSWWWVSAPLWIPISIILLIGLVLIIIMLLSN